MNFPTEKYDIIYCDPPWEYEVNQTFNGKKQTTGGAINHYNTMSVKEMSELPVIGIAAKNCLLYMWTSGPQMKETVMKVVIEAVIANDSNMLTGSTKHKKHSSTNLIGVCAFKCTD